MKIEEYIRTVPDFLELSHAQQVDYISLYLQKFQSQADISPSEIKEAADRLDVATLKDIARYLRLNSTSTRKKKSTKYVKKSPGRFCLSRKYYQDILGTLTGLTIRKNLEHNLDKYDSIFTSKEEIAFYSEMKTCFRSNAYRACIILVWNLTISRLYHHVVNSDLVIFNSVLSLNTDRRVKINSVSKYDDFTEIPEGKFIDLCRQAKIISNDQRKILEKYLGARNTYAHPSSFIASEAMSIAMVDDLILNIISRF